MSGNIWLKYMSQDFVLQRYGLSQYCETVIWVIVGAANSTIASPCNPSESGFNFYLELLVRISSQLTLSAKIFPGFLFLYHSIKPRKLF